MKGIFQTKINPLRPTKTTVRERNFSQNHMKMVKIECESLEKESLTFLNSMHQSLISVSSALRHLNQSLVPSKWILQIIDECKQKAREFNIKKKEDKHFYDNLSSKNINNDIHFELILILNLLSTLISQCSCAIKTLKTLKSVQNYDINQDTIDEEIECPLESVVRLTNKLLKVTKTIVRNNAAVSLGINNSKQFIDNLILLMIESGATGAVEETIFKNCIVIIEACLISKNFIFNADELMNVRLLLEKVTHRELSHLLRVLALLVLEVNDKQMFRVLVPMSGMSCTVNHIVMNHSLLVDSPSFLTKVHEVALSIIETMSQFMECRNETQLKDTIDALNKGQALERSGLCIKELQRIFVDTEFSFRYRNLLNKKFMIEYCLKNSSLMELLFILQNLLTGRKKVVVQNVLLQREFIENVLERLFDILFHREFNIDEIVSEEDEDSQDICFTARIQLLRLIINFCDRDDVNIQLKSRFISRSEHFLLQNIEIPLILYLHTDHQGPETLQPQQSIDKHDLHLSHTSASATAVKSKDLNQFEIKDCISYNKKLIEQCSNSVILSHEDYFKNIDNPDWKQHFEQLSFPTVLSKSAILQYKKNKLECGWEQKGLMHRIIDTLKTVGDNCQLRFWLASCVESFLRGAHWYLQLMVSQTGLLYFLTRQYVMNKLFKVNNIQITMDVLAELIKYNLHGVIYMNVILIEEDWIKKLDKIMFKNIVDTNVLLRNLYLTYERLDQLRSDDGKNQENSIVSKKQRKKCHSTHEQHNKLFNLLFCENSTSRILMDLIESVHEDNLNIDNISCIHSALVILIFHNAHGTFQNALEKIIPKFQDKKTILRFSKVLNTWTQYLQLKTREIYSLQFATGIPMAYFQEAIRNFCTAVEKSCNQMS